MVKFNTLEQIGFLNPRGILVTKDRYQGAYSEYVWTAWNFGNPIGDKDSVNLSWSHGEPCSARHSEFVCDEFWKSLKADTENFPIYGGGESPEKAVKNLLDKLVALEFCAMGLFAFIYIRDPYFFLRNSEHYKYVDVTTEDLFNNFLKHC